MSLCNMVERFALGLLNPRSIRPEAVQPAEWDIPDTHKRHAENLVDKALVRSVPYLNRSVYHTERVHPDLLRFIETFMRLLQSRSFPFFVHELVRDKHTQNAYFAKGVSKARWGSSAHNFGMAADIVHFGRYWELSKQEWNLVGALGKEAARKSGVKVTWGGDWASIWDPAHWELADWRKWRDNPDDMEFIPDYRPLATRRRESWRGYLNSVTL